MEDNDVDDIDLLQELLEIENELDNKTPTKVSKLSIYSQNNGESTSTGSFESVLEGLDSIPLKSCPVIKKKHSSNPIVKQTSCHLKNATNSAIHTGDTDSSDDEDNRKLEHRYDEYGATIKKMLDTSEETKASSNGFRGSSVNRSWKSSPLSSASGGSTLCLPLKKQKPPSDVYTEPLVGIRIVNPLVSSSVIKERLQGRKVVSFSQLKDFVSDGKIIDDWVFFGVIISKLPPKTSAKGSMYSIIRLSDLKGPGNLRTVSLFLFSRAFKDHGKDSVGSVLGILNPGILENSRNNSDEACLSVDNPDRIMIIGTSKDLGTCKSRKKNGENCTSIVNTAQCEHCVYHVKQEYMNCSRRSDIQSSFNGTGLTNLRNKVLGKSEVFYAGQSFTSVPAKKSKKLLEKDQKRLEALSGNKSPLLPALSQGPKKNSFAACLDLSHRQAQKDADRLRKLVILADQNSLSLPSQSNKVSTSADLKISDVKSAALSVIAKRKKTESDQPKCDNKVASKSVSDSLKNGDTSNKVVFARGSHPTEAVEKKDNRPNFVLPSALGLGCRALKKEDNQTKSSPELKPDGRIDSRNKHAVSDSFSSKLECKQSDKDFSPLSSQQLLKMSSNGFNLESRLLKQAARQTADNEEASKLGSNCTPSMMGLGRSSVKVTSQNSPMLGRGYNGRLLIDLDAHLNKKPHPLMPPNRKSRQSAKFNAINLVQKSGGIKKEDPNFREFESRKKSLNQTCNEKKGMKRPYSSIDNADSLNDSDTTQSVEELNAKMMRFKELMEASSKHTDLIETAENEAQDEYFKKLEKKEQLEEKMLNTFKVACKAVRCLVCKYTAFSASDLCKSQQHSLKVIDAMKRFWKCGDCGNRTISLELIPLKACSNCSSSRWEKAAMMRERKVGICQETLSIRGLEETFIGSVTTGGNINLLVPE